MKVGSLFAGVGGFDIAAERAGLEVAWQSEVDPAASRVLEHHWPGRNLGDIHNIRMETGDRSPREGSAVEGVGVPVGRGRRSDIGHAANGSDSGGTNERTAPAVDVLCGGFPCQDYSVAGNREGLAGDRGALWWEFHRLIAEGRPTWVVAENVPGLLSSRGGQDFATIIDSLTELGYGVAWGVLDAQYFGVAQRRRRVFIVGHSGGIPRPEVLALGQGLFGHPEPRRETRQRTSGDAANRLGIGIPDPTYGLTVRNAQDWPESGAATLVVGGSYADDHTGTITTTWAKGPGNTQVEEGALVAFAQNQRDEVRDLGNLSGALAAEPGMKQQTYVTHPQVRRLTPLECERLQGFPDGWTNIEGNSDTQRYRQMGNAVAVPVVEWIFDRIMEADDGS